MITTRLPSAEMMSAGVTWSPASRRFCWVRYSTAKCTPAELAAGNLEIARPGRPAAEHDCIELAPQAGHRQVDADLDAGPELDAFLRHQRQPAIDEALFELELGNAVTQQAADAVGPLEDGHVMPGLIQLVGGGEPGRTRSRRRPPVCPCATAGGRA